MKLPFNPSPWLSFLDPPAPPLLGIDVSAASVKVVELSRKRNGQIVYEGYAIEPLPREAVGHRDSSENSDRVNAEVSAAIGRAVKKLKSATRQVAVGMPANMVILKRIVVSDQMDESDIADEAAREMQKSMTFSLDEVLIDWDIMGPANNALGDVEALICATRRDRVLEREALVEMAGLRPRIIDVDSYASMRAFERMIRQVELEGKVCGVIDAGSRTTHVAFLQNGDLLFEREITLGSDSLVEELMRQKKAGNKDEAERVIAGGHNFEGYESRFLRPFIGNLASEIDRVLQYFLTQASAERVDHLFLAGGAALLQGLDSSVSELCGVPCERADLFTGIEVPARFARALKHDSLRLAVALGLAMRRFDPSDHD